MEAQSRSSAAARWTHGQGRQQSVGTDAPGENVLPVCVSFVAWATARRAHSNAMVLGMEGGRWGVR